MNDGSSIGSERDPILLRLELFLDGETIEDGRVKIARFTEPGPDVGADLSEGELTELACRIYESRRERARYLSMSLLGEPVWDMLLALYCFTARGRRMSVSSLCFASSVPQTTALRWVRVMEERKLVARVRDEKDGRRWFVILDERGTEAMERYLRSIHHSLGRGR